jgi:hypothetical protein
METTLLTDCIPRTLLTFFLYFFSGCIGTRQYCGLRPLGVPMPKGWDA